MKKRKKLLQNHCNTIIVEYIIIIWRLFYNITPLLEYASNVWSPHLITHINSLERVQRHFTKRNIALQDLSYEERLTVLNIKTLEHPRLSCDLTIYGVSDAESMSRRL